MHHLDQQPVVLLVQVELVVKHTELVVHQVHRGLVVNLDLWDSPVQQEQVEVQAVAVVLGHLDKQV